MNPFDEMKAEPNYWLSGLLIDEDAMCEQVRSETEALYIAEEGKVVRQRFWRQLVLLMQKADQYGSRCICSRCIECMNL